MTNRYTDDLKDYLADAVGAYKPDDSGNSARLLHDIWVWQEIKAAADDALRVAWGAAQAAELIPSDKELRADEGGGETIVAESQTYSAVVRCDAPRMNFDRDMFVGLVAAKFRLQAGEIAPLVDKAKKETAAPLTKRVIRVEPPKKKGKNK